MAHCRADRLDALLALLTFVATLLVGPEGAILAGVAAAAALVGPPHLRTNRHSANRRRPHRPLYGADRPEARCPPVRLSPSTRERVPVGEPARLNFAILRHAIDSANSAEEALIPD